MVLVTDPSNGNKDDSDDFIEITEFICSMLKWSDIGYILDLNMK